MTIRSQIERPYALLRAEQKRLQVCDSACKLLTFIYLQSVGPYFVTTGRLVAKNMYKRVPVVSGVKSNITLAAK